MFDTSVRPGIALKIPGVLLRPTRAIYWFDVTEHHEIGYASVVSMTRCEKSGRAGHGWYDPSLLARWTISSNIPALLELDRQHDASSKTAEAVSLCRPQATSWTSQYSRDCGKMAHDQFAVRSAFQGHSQVSAGLLAIT